MIIACRRSARFDRPHWLAGAALMGLAAVGCSRSGPPSVGDVGVDATAASNGAIEQYDVNHDGAIDKDELAQCPPLTTAFPTFDANNDGKLTADEITARIDRLYGTGAGLATFNGTVLISGQPLSGAQVRFRPIALLENDLQAAQGITDDAGLIRPAIDDVDLPDNLQGQAFIHPGFYHVDVTHPKRVLPSRYNTATELSAVVDPSSRNGLSARFDLNP